MAILKHKLPEGWNILYKEFFQKVVSICRQAVQRDKNLSDLDDIAAARANLGIDDIYVPKDNPVFNGPITLKDNTWNYAGNDSLFGDKNIQGKFAIKGQNGSIATGLALVANNSSNNSNYGAINYDGTNLEFSKPIFATQGFACKTVNEADLNTNTQCNFFYGKASSSSSILPTAITDDYSGICIGNYQNGSGDNPDLTQLVFDANHAYFRECDSGSQWSTWKEFAFMSDIPTDTAKKDGSNITSIGTWATALNKGSVASGNTGLVSGGKIYTAIETAKSAAITSANTNTTTQLANYAKIDASNITATTWATKLKGSVANGNNLLVTGGQVYTYLNDYAKKNASDLSAANKTSWINALGINGLITDALAQHTPIIEQSLRTNGYVIFKSGLMIQWGRNLIKNETCSTINFSKPFLTMPYAIIANMQRESGTSVGGSYTRDALTGNMSTTGFEINAYIESGGPNIYIPWIALGLGNPDNATFDVYVYAGERYSDWDTWVDPKPAFTLYVNNVAQTGTLVNWNRQEAGIDIIWRYYKYSVPYGATVKYVPTSYSPCSISTRNTTMDHATTDGVTVTEYTSQPIVFTMGFEDITINDQSGQKRIAVTTENSGSNPWVKVTYTLLNGSTYTTKRLGDKAKTTFDIKYNTTITFTSDETGSDYRIDVYQNGSKKVTLSKGQSWTSGSITSDDTFTCRGWDVNCDCDCGDDG